MLKKILTIIVVLIALAYLTYAMATFSGNPTSVKCRDVRIEVISDSDQPFVKEAEIKQLLERNGVKLKGKKIGEIDFNALEKKVESYTLIEKAECYASPSGTVCINVWQQFPVLRIISPYGNYYVDSNGKKTGLSTHSAANVVVASGHIKDSVTVRELYRMAVILQTDKIWDALVEQIFVEDNGEWIIIPRTGDFEILFGMPVNMETKMKRINVFLKDYLPVMGWDRYSKINLKFNNQIICTKKEISQKISQKISKEIS